MSNDHFENKILAAINENREVVFEISTAVQTTDASDTGVQPVASANPYSTNDIGKGAPFGYTYGDNQLVGYTDPTTLNIQQANVIPVDKDKLFNPPAFTNHQAFYPSQQRIGQLEQETRYLNTFTCNDRASRAYLAMLQEKEEDNRKALLLSNLGSKELINLSYGKGHTMSADLLDSLPTDLREVAEYIALKSGWHIFPVLMALLVAISISLHGRYKVRLNSMWEEAVAIYVLIVSLSGTRKSMIVNLLKKVFNEFIYAKQQEHAINNPSNKLKVKYLNKYESMAASKIISGIIDGCIQSGKKDYADDGDMESPEQAGWNFPAGIERVMELSEELCVIDKAQSTITEKPNIFADNITQKRLARNMAQNGECTAFFSDEDNMLQRMARSRDFDAKLMLDGFTMGANMHETMHYNDAVLSNPVLNIGYIVQPRVLYNFYHSRQLSDLGVLPRFLPIFETVVISEPDDTPTEEGDALLQHYYDKIYRNLERNFTQRQDRKIYICSVTAEAMQEIKKFQSYCASYIRQGRLGFMESALRKAHGMAVRIACILHAWMHTAPEAVPISRETMISASLIMDSLLPHVEYAFNPMGQTANGDANRLLNWIKRNHILEFIYQEAQRGIGIKNELIIPAADILEQHHFISRLPRKNKTPLCVVNPRLFN